MDKHKIVFYNRGNARVIPLVEVIKMSTAANSIQSTQTDLSSTQNSLTISAAEYRTIIARKSKSIIGRTFEELYKEEK
jgi:hypothetical protein